MPRYDDDGNLIPETTGAATGGSATLRFDDDGNPIAPSSAPPGPIVRAATPEDRNFKQFITENVPESAGRMVSGLTGMIAHPINTARMLGSVAQGGLEKVERTTGVPADLALTAMSGPFAPVGITTRALLDAQVGRGNEPVFDAAAQSMADRYGGVENIKTTAYEDPVGAAADVAGVLLGGESALATSMPRTAKYLGMIGRTIDPVSGSAKIVGAMGKGLGKGIAFAGESYLGKSTGVGKDAIQTAVKGSPEFQKYMRGNEPAHEQIWQTVKNSVGTLVDRRRRAYQQQLAALPQNITLDIKPVYGEMRSALSKFGVKVKATPKGPELDFSRSDFRNLPREQAKVEALFGDVMGWGTQQGDMSPLGIDRLKKGIGDLITEGDPGPGDAFVKSVQDKVKVSLEQQVPGYKEMTADYAQASEFLRDVTSELSMSKGAPKGVGIRKLTTALNQRSEYRKNLIEALDTELGTDLQGALAGTEMNSLFPRGLMGPASVSMLPVGVAVALKGLSVNPITAIGALMGTVSFSPRLVGELLLKVAQARRSRLAQLAGVMLPVAKEVIFDPGTYRFVQAAKEGKQQAEENAKPGDMPIGVPPPPPGYIPY